MSNTRLNTKLYEELMAARNLFSKLRAAGGHSEEQVNARAKAFLEKERLEAAWKKAKQATNKLVAVVEAGHSLPRNEDPFYFYLLYGTMAAVAKRFGVSPSAVSCRASKDFWRKKKRDLMARGVLSETLAEMKKGLVFKDEQVTIDCSEVPSVHEDPKQWGARSPHWKPDPKIRPLTGTCSIFGPSRDKEDGLPLNPTSFECRVMALWKLKPEYECFHNFIKDMGRILDCDPTAVAIVIRKSKKVFPFSREFYSSYSTEQSVW